MLKIYQLFLSNLFGQLQKIKWRYEMKAVVV